MARHDARPEPIHARLLRIVLATLLALAMVPAPSASAAPDALGWSHQPPLAAFRGDTLLMSVMPPAWCAAAAYDAALGCNRLDIDLLTPGPGRPQAVPYDVVSNDGGVWVLAVPGEYVTRDVFIYRVEARSRNCGAQARFREDLRIDHRRLLVPRCEWTDRVAMPGADAWFIVRTRPSVLRSANGGGHLN